MHHYYKIGLLLLLVSALVSCEGEEENYTAYFGGEVINPSIHYIIFSKDNKALDTIPLDKDNRFFIKFDSLASGLYTFRHDPNYQYIYFDKNDSLMISVNTADFVGSLSFSGKGERKNNYMAELSQMQEEDRNEGYGIYSYDLKRFSKTIDSIYAKRLATYNRNKTNIKWSSDFDFYAKSRLDLNYYAKKEYYPYIHTRRKGASAALDLPSTYYGFRESVNVNDARLTNFSPFVKYLTVRLNNMAILHPQRSGKARENALDDNIMKLNIADTMFTDEGIKNEVLNNIAFAYLLEDQNIANNQKFLEQFMKLSTDMDPHGRIRKLGEAIKNLSPGNRLPEMGLVTLAGDKFDIKEHIQSKTVIFFWTACARARLKMVYEKVASLKKDNPHISFIAVNVDEDAEWKKMIKKYPFGDALHLRATDFNRLRDEWAITKINRTIVLKEDGTVKNGFTNLMDDKFGQQLK